MRIDNNDELREFFTRGGRSALCAEESFEVDEAKLAEIEGHVREQKGHYSDEKIRARAVYRIVARERDEQKELPYRVLGSPSIDKVVRQQAADVHRTNQAVRLLHAAIENIASRESEQHFDRLASQHNEFADTREVLAAESARIGRTSEAIAQATLKELKASTGAMTNAVTGSRDAVVIALGQFMDAVKTESAEAKQLARKAFWIQVAVHGSGYLLIAGLLLYEIVHP